MFFYCHTLLNHSCSSFRCSTSEHKVATNVFSSVLWRSLTQFESTCFYYTVKISVIPQCDWFLENSVKLCVDPMKLLHRTRTSTPSNTSTNWTSPPNTTQHHPTPPNTADGFHQCCYNWIRESFCSQAPKVWNQRTVKGTVHIRIKETHFPSYLCSFLSVWTVLSLSFGDVRALANTVEQGGTQKNKSENSPATSFTQDNQPTFELPSLVR